jgi:hypothetical protein
MRWALEIASAGDRLACTLAVENRTPAQLLLKTLVPLARGTLDEGTPATGPAPLLPVHVLPGAPDAFLGLGFTTELRLAARLCWREDPAFGPAFALENALAGRSLEPGESIESERAWLAIGAEEARLLAEWAELSSLEMQARATGRGLFLAEAKRESLPKVMQVLRPSGEPVVVEPVGDLADPRSLEEFARETRALGATPGATLQSALGPRAELAAECTRLRSLGIEHVSGPARETTLGSVGLIDTLRLSDLPGPDAVSRALDMAFHGQRLWSLDLGLALLPGSSPPSEQERTYFCVCALGGGTLRLRDPHRLDAVRARWLRLATPPLARPAVALPIPGGRALVVPLVGGRHAVLLVNESKVTRELGASFRSLGIAGSQHLFEFWEEWALGEAPEEVSPEPMAPGASRLLAFTPVTPRPQVIGTTLHLGMGSLEASGPRAREGLPLELTLRLPGRRKGAVFVAIPGEGVRRIEVSFEDTLSLALSPAAGPG